MQAAFNLVLLLGWLALIPVFGVVLCSVSRSFCEIYRMWKKDN